MYTRWYEAQEGVKKQTLQTPTADESSWIIQEVNWIKTLIEFVETEEDEKTEQEELKNAV